MSNVYILDMGTDHVRLGYAGDPIPSHTYSTYINKSNDNMLTALNGEDARERAMMTMNDEFVSFMEHSTVTQWDDCQLVLNQLIFNDMKMEPSESTMLIGESNGVSWANRENILQVMFEKYNFAECILKDRGLLSLYGEGITSTGVVVKVGAGTTQIRCICDGFSIDTSTEISQFAGRDITNNLIHWINQRNTAKFDLKKDFFKVDHLKGRHMRMYNHRPSDLNVSSNIMVHYRLPDDNELKIPKKLFTNCSEALFDPLVIEEDWKGITDLVIKSIGNAPIHCRKMIMDNIILSGGTTLIKGFDDRLLTDLKEWRNVPMRIKNKRVNRCLNSWMGGAMLGSMYLGQDERLTKQDYEEGNFKRLFKYPGIGEHFRC